MLRVMASAAEWAKRVRAWRASGVSAGEFAAGQDFADSTLRWWAWRVGKGESSAPGARPVRLLRLVRQRAGAMPISASTTSAPLVTVEIGGTRVSVPAGVQRETLRDVLEVLRAIETTGR